MASAHAQEINQLIGDRLRVARKAAGLTLRALSKKLGISHTKVHTIEQGITQVHVSDLCEMADALDVPPLILLQDIEDFAHLRTCLQLRYRGVRDKAPQAAEEVLRIIRWYDRQMQLSDQPVYYRGFSKPLVEFEEEWHHPVMEEGNRFLYIAKVDDGLRGLCFKEEIIPSDSPYESDVPAIRDSMWWEDEIQLRRWLQENGYCWQVYPTRIHHNEYCSPKHRATLRSSSTERRKG